MKKDRITISLSERGHVVLEKLVKMTGYAKASLVQMSLEKLYKEYREDNFFMDVREEESRDKSE